MGQELVVEDAILEVAILVLVSRFWFVDYFDLISSQRLLFGPVWSAWQPASLDDGVLVDESWT